MAPKKKDKATPNEDLINHILKSSKAAVANMAKKGLEVPDVSHLNDSFKDLSVTSLDDAPTHLGSGKAASSTSNSQESTSYSQSFKSSADINFPTGYDTMPDSASDTTVEHSRMAAQPSNAPLHPTNGHMRGSKSIHEFKNPRHQSKGPHGFHGPSGRGQGSGNNGKKNPGPPGNRSGHKHAPNFRFPHKANGRRTPVDNNNVHQQLALTKALLPFNDGVPDPLAKLNMHTTNQQNGSSSFPFPPPILTETMSQHGKRVRLLGPSPVPSQVGHGGNRSFTPVNAPYQQSLPPFQGRIEDLRYGAGQHGLMQPVSNMIHPAMNAVGYPNYPQMNLYPLVAPQAGNYQAMPPQAGSYGPQGSNYQLNSYTPQVGTYQDMAPQQSSYAPQANNYQSVTPQPSSYTPQVDNNQALGATKVNSYPVVAPQPSNYQDTALQVSTHAPLTNSYPAVVPQPTPCPAEASEDNTYPVPAPLVNTYLTRPTLIAPRASLIRYLTRAGRPMIEDILQPSYVPFVELGRHAQVAQWGVIKITNIPYNIMKSDIEAFLGTGIKYIPVQFGPAIHIIMERSTSKTMECFVELLSWCEALDIVKRFAKKKEEGYILRILERHVNVELSGQAELMQEMFPKAKCVEWEGAQPIIKPPIDEWTSGFQSFLNPEELVMIVKHAESPQRAPFSQRCLNRTYESLISTLWKYPWFDVDHITLEARDLLFDAMKKMITILFENLKRSHAPIYLNVGLMNGLVLAGLMCPGFNERQKLELTRVAQYQGEPFGITKLAYHWPFEVLGRRADVPEDVLKLYAGLLYEASASSIPTLAERSGSIQAGVPNASAFGIFEVDWPEDKKNLTMAQAANLEWALVEKLLRKALEEPTF
ncbi:MAG: hypothetical protein M1829_004691 [Trizodia sp. TS-e1964]|nr:MAG: hypothetical protein M1829_004691 [Trizodia sp. TS-e1964]